MRVIRLLPLLLALILLAPPLLSAAASSKKKPSSPAKKAAAKQSSKKAAAKSSSSRKSPVAKASRSRRRPARRSVARNRGQRTPEPERIKQIQSALASRGYEIEPTGVWDNRSMAALRKFQDDNQINNLTGKGKLDPLTLIALGLGPDRGSQAAKPKTNTEGQQP